MIQKYLRNIFYDIITDIIEMENKNVFMEPNRIRDYFIQKNKEQENLIIKENNNKEKEKDKNIFHKIKNFAKPRSSYFPTNDTFNEITNDNMVRNSIAINTNQYQTNLSNSLNN